MTSIPVLFKNLKTAKMSNNRAVVKYEFWYIYVMEYSIASFFYFETIKPLKVTFLENI